MKYKKQVFPKAMLKSLVEDINNLVGKPCNAIILKDLINKRFGDLL